MHFQNLSAAIIKLIKEHDFISCCSAVRPVPRTPNKIQFGKPCWVNWAQIHLLHILSTAPRCRSFVAAAATAALGFICPWGWSLRRKQNLNNTRNILVSFNVCSGFSANPSKMLSTSFVKVAHYIRPSCKCNRPAHSAHLGASATHHPHVQTHTSHLE